MKILLSLIIASLLLASCGPGITEKPLNERMVGKWSGLLVNKEGNRTPIEWEFLEGGTMVIRFPMINISYGGTWSAEGSRLNFTTEVDPEEKNYRDVEFVSEEVIRLTKEGITETFTRVKE